MAGYIPSMGNDPGPKIQKMGVQWTPKIKNGQKPRDQTQNWSPFCFWFE